MYLRFFFFDRQGACQNRQVKGYCCGKFAKFVSTSGPRSLGVNCKSPSEVITQLHKSPTLMTPHGHQLLESHVLSAHPPVNLSSASDPTLSIDRSDPKDDNSILIILYLSLSMLLFLFYLCKSEQKTCLRT